MESQRDKFSPPSITPVFIHHKSFVSMRFVFLLLAVRTKSVILGFPAMGRCSHVVAVQRYEHLSQSDGMN